LWLGLRKSGVFVWQAGWLKYLLQLILSTGVLLAVLLILNPSLEQWMAGDWLQRALWMAMLVASGGAGYLLTLVLTGLRLRHLRH
jgi:putative peptidoglycan lipid II flippase